MVEDSNDLVSARINASAKAVWQGPRDGIVTFTDMGWSVDTVPPGAVFVELPDDTGFVYTFVADGAGLWTLSYTVFGTPFNVGFISGFSIDWAEGDGGQLFQIDAALVNTSGAVVRPLVEGQTYSFRIGPGTLGVLSGSIKAEITGTFTFTIETR